MIRSLGPMGRIAFVRIERSSSRNAAVLDNFTGPPITFALDFDGTFTLSPRYWQNWILHAKTWGHTVIVVTYRQPGHPLEFDFAPLGVQVIYTDHVAKKKYMETQGIKIDVWVDDRPEVCVTDGLQ